MTSFAVASAAVSVAPRSVRETDLGLYARYENMGMEPARPLKPRASL